MLWTWGILFVKTRMPLSRTVLFIFDAIFTFFSKNSLPAQTDLSVTGYLENLDFYLFTFPDNIGYLFNVVIGEL